MLKDGYGYFISSNIYPALFPGLAIMFMVLAFNLVGNGLANVLTGNSASNILLGGSGNDILNGRQGADDMRGSAGRQTISNGIPRGRSVG